MKILNNLLIIIFLFIISACGTTGKQDEAAAIVETSKENIITADYKIEGMVCAMGCAATIQKEVSTLQGVTVCDVDFESGKAHLEFNESLLTEKDIISKIEKIADGQYKVEEWIEGSSNNDEESNGSDEETVTEVSLPSFEIPNLFTLLMDQI